MVVICPKCEGEGKVLIQESEMCPKCRGLGLIKLVVGGGKPTNKDICTNCKGTGKIFKKIVKDCSECKGSGKISKTCLLCDNEIENGLLYCNNCLENPYVYQVVLPASKNTIEFNKTYMAKVVKVVDFGYFVAIAPNLEGLIRSKDHKEKVGNNIYVKLKNIKGEKLEFKHIKIENDSNLIIKRVHDVISLQKISTKREEGSYVSIHGRVENIRQIPKGPKIFKLLDETGVIEAAAFQTELGNEIKIGDIVEVIGQFTTHKETEQIEISDIFTVDPVYSKVFIKKMNEKLDTLSQPDEIDFLVKSDILNALKSKFITIAKRLRRAILEFQPIIIRHHADADGITSGIAIETALRDLWMKINGNLEEDQLRHIVKRTVNKPPFYDPLDAVRDLNQALEDQERFGDKLPLIILLDTGSSEENLFSYKLLKAYDLEIFIVDHHFPSSTIQETIDVHLNVYFVGGDYNICSGMLGVELARFIHPDTTKKLIHLPAIAGIGDRVTGNEMDHYLKLAKEKEGYSEDFMSDIALAVDYQAYFLKFSPGRFLLLDLLGLQKADEQHISFVKLLASEAQKHLENQLLISLEYVQEDILPNGIKLALLDVEKYTSRFDYPPPGKITGSLFDHLVKKDEKKPLVAIGLGPDFAIFRSQNVKLDFPNLVRNCSSKLPHAGVEGGGHEIVGSMKFITGARDELTKLIREMLTLIEL